MLTKEQVETLKRREAHLTQRIKDNKSKDLSFDKQERAAIRAAIYCYSNELTKLQKLAGQMAAGALADGASVDEAADIGFETATKLMAKFQSTNP